MNSINLRKLSSILDLSISTVSKALRDSHEISAETKKRVLEVARAHNYQPNIYASSLRKSKSKTIGVIVPRIENNFFISAIDGIHKIAREHNYHVLIYLSHESAIYEKDLAESLSNGRVDGLLISLSKETESLQYIENFLARNIPVVFFDRIGDLSQCSSVTTNDYESSYRATEHLIASGCTKIAHCKISQNISIGQLRFSGFQAAVRSHNLKENFSHVIECTDEYESDYLRIKTLLKSRARPDGIFTAIESYALIVYEVCTELCIKIPEQLKVVTFSNLRTADLLNPSLTTITQPAFEMGETAALQLIAAIEKPGYFKPEHIVINSQLTQRRSTERI